MQFQQIKTYTSVVLGATAMAVCGGGGGGGPQNDDAVFYRNIAGAGLSLCHDATCQWQFG